MSSDISIGEPLFEFNQVTLGWPGQPVLHSISLRIQKGEKLAVIGRSGSGKSTLLHHLYQQSSLQTAFCEQSPGLVSSLSVFHNIYMGQLDRHSFLYNAANLLWPLRKEKHSISALAKLMGLEDKLSEKAEALSGGQQQRVALARCLHQAQKVFIGDEPVSAVDETQADALLRLITARHDTVILALHHQQQVLKHCTRVVGLQQGKIVLDEKSANLSPSDLNVFYAESTPPLALSIPTSSIAFRSVG